MTSVAKIGKRPFPSCVASYSGELTCPRGDPAEKRSPCRPASPKDSVRSELRGPQRAEKRLGNAMAGRSRALFVTNHKTPQNAVILALHGTRFETMAILVKALKCATKRLHAFP